jgi:hypothetical protein
MIERRIETILSNGIEKKPVTRFRNMGMESKPLA